MSAPKHRPSKAVANPHTQKNIRFSPLKHSKNRIKSGWSWGDLNPRPNVELMSFLHAYSRVGFRAVAGTEPPTMALASKISGKPRSAAFPIPDLAAPPYRGVSGPGLSGDVSSA